MRGQEGADGGRPIDGTVGTPCGVPWPVLSRTPNAAIAPAAARSPRDEDAAGPVATTGAISRMTSPYAPMMSPGKSSTPCSAPTPISTTPRRRSTPSGARSASRASP